MTRLSQCVRMILNSATTKTSRRYRLIDWLKYAVSLRTVSICSNWTQLSCSFIVCTTIYLWVIKLNMHLLPSKHINLSKYTLYIVYPILVVNNRQEEWEQESWCGGLPACRGCNWGYQILNVSHFILLRKLNSISSRSFMSWYLRFEVVFYLFVKSITCYC